MESTKKILKLFQFWRNCQSTTDAAPKSIDSTRAVKLNNLKWTKITHYFVLDNRPRLVIATKGHEKKSTQKIFFQEKTFQSEKLLNSIERNVLTDVPFPSKNLIEWLLHVLAIDSRRKLESSCRWAVKKRKGKLNDRREMSFYFIIRST